MSNWKQLDSNRYQNLKGTVQLRKDGTDWNFVSQGIDAGEVILSLDDIINNPISPLALAAANGTVGAWTAWTPTFAGLGTVSAVNMFYKQIGDSYLMHGTVTVGTPTGVAATMTLPGGKSIDTSKIDTTSRRGGFGAIVRETTATNSITSAAAGTTLFTMYNGTATLLQLAYRVSSNLYLDEFGSAIASAGDVLNFLPFMVPIVGIS